MNASQILDREYLEMRARILELAACLDRLDRAEGDVDDEEKLISIRKGIELLSAEGERAKNVQLLFSREYQESWAEDFEIKSRL